MKTTVLNALHRSIGGRMVEFGGFDMPVQYTSIIDEHVQVRERAGLFDLCHMGRFEFTGPNAVAAVDSMITNHVEKMKPGQIRYALVLNDDGGVRDDVLVYRLPDSVWLVVNAGNRDKLLGWFGDRFPTDGVTFTDRSEEWAMIAVQGPKAESILAPVAKTTWIPALPELGYYKMSDVALDIEGAKFEGWVSRTGYTGEDGFEIYTDSSRAEELWHALAKLGGDVIAPCGLGARDTLRLEAGMPLYGHELEENISPLEAGLSFGIRFKKPNGFIGADALKKVKEEGPKRRLAAFKVDGRRVVRQGMPVFSGDTKVGEVTSGAPSPTLGCNIAVAYLPADSSDTGLEAEVRGHRVGLIPHEFPFYSRTRK